ELQKELSRGIPLSEAIQKRNLPDMYRRMVRIGVSNNDLPGVLTLIADHYDRANSLWTRLKGLMVYPVLVVIVSLGLTTLVSVVFNRFLSHFLDQFALRPPFAIALVWMPPILLCFVVICGAAAMFFPKWRGQLRWKLPGFREASLAQLASAVALMLKKGTPL